LELVRVAITPSPPSDFAYSSVAVEPQTVSVAGPSDVLRRARTVRVLLELTEREMAKLAREKSSVFQINPVVLDADGHQLQGVQVDPASVTVRVSVSEQQSEKQVLISPQLRGQALAGYRLAAIECNPLTAVVVGRATILSGISSVETEPIDVSDLSADKDFEAHLRVPAGVALRGRPTARIRVRVVRL
jgi:YbbR domain-containing protein